MNNRGQATVFRGCGNIRARIRGLPGYSPNLITLFEYPAEIRKAIYTANAIESLNSVIRKATQCPKLLPRDESALKVAFLAIQAASKKWKMTYVPGPSYHLPPPNLSQ